MPRRLSHAFRRFLDDRSGTVTVETVLVLPLLVWAYLAIYIFFDAFATITTCSKASYTIADALSRQRQEVNRAFLDSSHTLFRWLVRSEATTMRVSSITWSDTDAAYRVAWSYASPGRTPQTNASIATQAAQIPVLPDGDHVILVETWTDYRPLFLQFLDPFTATEFIVTRPRFMPKLEFVA